MYYDLHWSKTSYSNQFKSDMEDFILVIVILLNSDKGFGPAINMSWIFVQKAPYEF